MYVSLAVRQNNSVVFSNSSQFHSFIYSIHYLFSYLSVVHHKITSLKLHKCVDYYHSAQHHLVHNVYMRFYCIAMIISKYISMSISWISENHRTSIYHQTICPSGCAKLNNPHRAPYTWPGYVCIKNECPYK